MFSGEEIKQFYKEYTKNLIEADKLKELTLNASSKEEWEAKTKERRAKAKELFNSNTALLEKYIYPLLNDELELNADIADAYFQCAKEFVSKGYTDYVTGIDTFDKLAKFYEKNKRIEKYINCRHMTSFVCAKEPNYENLERAKQDISIELQYVDDFLNIEDETMKKCIGDAPINYLINLLNELTTLPIDNPECMQDYQKTLIESVKKAHEFYTNEKVRNHFSNNDRCDRNIYLLNVIVCGNIIGEIDARIPLNNELLEYTYNALDIYYKKEKEKYNDIYKIDDGIFCNYWITKYRIGKVPLNDFISVYIDYCKQCIENEVPDNDEDILDSKYFNVCLVRLPYLLQYTKLENYDENKSNEIVIYAIEAYLGILKYFPTFRTRARASREIEEAAIVLVPFLPANVSPFYFLLKVIINRDETLMLHAAMVGRMGKAILEKVFDVNPALLVGILDTKSISEVLENKQHIIEFYTRASMAFDIGKTGYTSILNIDTRRLTAKERKLLENHTIEGYHMARNLSDMDPFLDVIRGHHKTYDGKGGYPASFDNRNSKVRFITDLIRICDCMDAATDYIGRNYTSGKTFETLLEEFEKGAGTLYNPDIIEIIKDSNELKHTLNEYCTLNREDIYYEMYYDLLQKENKNSLEESNTKLPVWAKGTMRIVEIDFFRDTIKTLYQSGNIIMPVEVSGKFDTFMQEQLKPYVYEPDWDVLQSLLSYGSLSDKLNAHDGKYELELRLKKADTWQWVRFQFAVEEEHFGIPQKLVLSIHDIDEQCRQRQEMMEALERANIEAKQASRAKSLFISNISHEIRTPMNAIIGMVEILLRDVKDEKEREYLGNIQTSGHALLSLVNDILDFSKMEAGKLDITNVEYDTVQTINDLTMAFLKRIGEKPVELIFDIDKNLPNKLVGDESRLRQVIINIVNNAIKFTDSGCIRLKIYNQEIQGSDITLAFSVKDTGIGIKKEDIPKLFGAFSQVDTRVNYEKEGTGLGLIISKQIVELMGGTIWVESVYGEGTEFHFTIKQKLVEDNLIARVVKNTIDERPVIVGTMLENNYLVDNIKKLCLNNCLEFIDLLNREDDYIVPDFIFTDVKLAATAHEFNRANTASVVVLYNPMTEIVNDTKAIMLSKPLYSVNFCRVINQEEAVSVKGENCLNFVAPEANILLVDDTEMNITVAKGLLGPIGMHIDTAQNGAIAVEMIQDKEYDLVLMDHKMPVMDGVEATQAIRALDGDYYREVPIIALTANAVVEARKLFEDAGMNDFVAKPIEINEICKKLRKWLSQEKIIDKEIILEEKKSILPEKIEGINIKEALKNTGNEEMLMELLIDFYNLIDVKSEKIRGLLTEGDIRNYTIEVHAMKSVARMVGALDLSDKFKQLEAWSDEGEVEKLYENTENTLLQYIAYKSYLKEFVSSCQVEGGDEIPKEELMEILVNIIESMRVCDMDMLDMCVDRVKTGKLPDNVSQDWDKLKLAIADFDMEGTIGIAEEMIDKLK